MRPPATGRTDPALASLIAVCVAIEAVLSGADLGWWGQPHWRALAYDLGAFRPRLLAGESGLFPLQAPVMFLSHAFLHAGILHLTGNMLALAALGRGVMRRFGRLRFVAILLVSTLAGAASFALLSADSGPMVGASGALFGLAGALAPRRVAPLARVVAGLAALNLALWVLSSGLLAWQAHLGGFVAGLVLARVFRRHSPR